MAALVAIAVGTGLWAQATGTQWVRLPVIAHGIAAFGLVLLVPWKAPIVDRGIRRGGRGRIWSLALAVVTAVTVVSGFIQMSGATFRFGPLTTMQVHVGGGVVTAALVVVHMVRHPVRPRRTDLGRRTFIRTGVLGLGAGVAWIGWEGTVRALGWPGAERRHTGSHERGSGNPAAMPATQWFTDTAPRIDAATWSINVGTRSLGPEDVEALPLETLTATLDCTSGWYSEQEWRGVRLDRLLDIGDAASIEVRSVTGYSRRFPATDADRLWLAFEVGSAPLSRGHGFPARLVAPGRRGFWWIKWVDGVATSNVPWWLQSPFPLQ
jgi:hypothetical protein